MARKEDKLRPYRVDYFDIEEMKDNDLALVKSVIVRAVTATEAIYHNSIAQEGRIIIRSARFYKTLTHKKDIYKAVEDLFSANKAITIMEAVEAYRAKKAAPPAPPAPPAPVMTPVPQAPVPTPEQAGTGPDSPATVAVVADLNGMLQHDAHEQTMDTFVPTAIPEGKRVPDLTNALPVEPLIEPDQAVGSAGRPRIPHWYGCSCAVCTPLTEIPLYIKVLMFSAALALVIGVILHFCH